MNKKIDHSFEKRLLSISECCDYVGLGRNSTMKLMKRIGAECKIGSRHLFDKYTIDQYIDCLLCDQAD